MKFRQIIFKNEEYLLIAGKNDLDGAIATKEQYENGVPSFAHLFEDGKIKRYGEIIGTIEDIVFTGEEIEPEVNVNAVPNVMLGFANPMAWIELGDME